MDKNEKIVHLRQLSKAVDSLIEAIENSNPVDDWNYTEEQLLDRSEMLSFREMQLTGRMRFIGKVVIGEYDVICQVGYKS